VDNENEEKRKNGFKKKQGEGAGIYGFVAIGVRWWKIRAAAAKINIFKICRKPISEGPGGQTTREEPIRI